MACASEAIGTDILVENAGKEVHMRSHYRESPLSHP
jgi:hypothetical protein